MTTQEILELAGRDVPPWVMKLVADCLTREAGRVASQIIGAAVVMEREACAKVCETLGVHPALNVYAGGPEWYKHGKDIAAAIRARGQQ